MPALVARYRSGVEHFGQFTARPGSRQQSSAICRSVEAAEPLTHLTKSKLHGCTARASAAVAIFHQASNTGTDTDQHEGRWRWNGFF